MNVAGVTETLDIKTEAGSPTQALAITPNKESRRRGRPPKPMRDVGDLSLVHPWRSFCVLCGRETWSANRPARAGRCEGCGSSLLLEQTVERVARRALAWT
jgi:DNA-directed RNA polymerase subunit RPC12/RpoP